MLIPVVHTMDIALHIGNELIIPGQDREGIRGTTSLAFTTALRHLMPGLEVPK